MAVDVMWELAPILLPPLVCRKSVRDNCQKVRKHNFRKAEAAAKLGSISYLIKKYRDKNSIFKVTNQKSILIFHMFRRKLTN